MAPRHSICLLVRNEFLAEKAADRIFSGYRAFLKPIYPSISKVVSPTWSIPRPQLHAALRKIKQEEQFSRGSAHGVHTLMDIGLTPVCPHQLIHPPSFTILYVNTLLPTGDVGGKCGPRGEGVARVFKSDEDLFKEMVLKRKNGCEEGDGAICGNKARYYNNLRRKEIKKMNGPF